MVVLFNSIIKFKKKTNVTSTFKDLYFNISILKDITDFLK